MLYTIDYLIFKIGSNKRKISIARKWGVRIGENSRIENFVSLGSEPYLIAIGNDCWIAPHVIFITHDMSTSVVRAMGFKGFKFMPIIVHDNCFIGLHSIILPDVEIGPNSIVGAGSVVTKTVPPGEVHAGNPARFICTIDEYMKKCAEKSAGDLPELDDKQKKEYLLKRFEQKLNGRR